MAETVLATIVRRLVSEGRLSMGDGIAVPSGRDSEAERPPLAGVIAR
jgi:hypothetical protein